MESGLEVRAATAADAGDLRRLTAVLGYEVAPEQVAEHLAAVAAQPGECAVLVATRGDAVVGWIEVRVEHALALAGPSAIVVGLAVDEDRRRRGVGAALLDAAERWALERGAAQLRVRSRVERTGAHAFYAARGYEPVKTQTAFRRRLGE